MTAYGVAPEPIGTFDLDFTEYMHFMYLPVYIGQEGFYDFRLPRRLDFARELIQTAAWHENVAYDKHWAFIYVTARRGYATPGNPLNRPGWHADGFGTDDVNYVWTDRFPTLFAEQEFTGISTDHNVSIEQFTEQIAAGYVVTYPDRMLLRLDSSVIHAAPEIPAPGGERSFFKVSFSNERYALRGNSHNHLFDYDWPLLSRDAVRNDPARSGSDSAATS